MAGMMVFLTPSVGWAVPLLWPIALAVAGAKGYVALTAIKEDSALRGQLNQEMANLRTVAVPLDSVVKDIVADEVGREQVLRFQKEDITLIFKRDARGKFVIEVMGPATMTARQLQVIGLDFAQDLVQQFAASKMAAEMEKRGATVIGEEITDEEEVVLHLRRWK